MQLNKNQEKVDFLEVFFNSIRGLDYGVIDIDNNLRGDIKNDIDIWVSKFSIEILVKKLQVLATSKGWLIKKMNVSPRIGPAAEGKYALAFINNPEIVIQLDLWVCFHWRGVPFTNSNLNSAVIEFQNYKKINNKSAIFIQIIKDIIYNGKLSPKVIRRIEKVGLNTDSAYQVLEGCFPNSFINMINNNDLYDISSKETKLEIVKNFVKNRLPLKLFLFIKYATRFLHTRIISQQGIHVVLVGPDGCGKTTVGDLVFKSEFVHDYYEKRERMHTRFKIIPALATVLSIFKTKDKNHKINMREVKPVSVFKSVVYPSYYSLDYFLGHFWKYSKYTNGGCYVQFDRYFSEYYIQPVFKNTPKALLNILKNFVPKYDLIILIEDSPESIHSRKKELSLGEIKTQIKKYRALIESDNNGYAVQNSGDPKIAANEILKLIIKHEIQKKGIV